MHDILLVQIYVDDIIFGSTNDSLCKEFSKDMQSEFEMSMMDELNFFLGLQIKQRMESLLVKQNIAKNCLRGLEWKILNK